jgi:hypothetical protein
MPRQKGNDDGLLATLRGVPSWTLFATGLRMLSSIADILAVLLLCAEPSPITLVFAGFIFQVPMNGSAASGYYSRSQH